MPKGKKPAGRSPTPIQVIADLERRARNGDISAQVRLQQVFFELENMLGPTEVLGEEQAGGTTSVDELDIAESLSSMYPGHVDELAYKAAVKAKKFENMGLIAPQVNINPPSLRHGTLGQSLTVALGEHKPVARWIADDDTETTTVTVTLTPVKAAAEDPKNFVQNANPFAVSPNPSALITFGCRGVTTLFQVDIGAGAVFTLGASSVGVEVFLDGPPGIALPASMQLGGWLSFLPSSRVLPIQRSKQFAGMNTGVMTVIVRPPFSVAVLPVQMSDPNGSVRLDFFNFQQALIYSLVIPSPGAQVAPIPLSADVFFIGVTSLGVAAQNVRLITALSL